MENIGEVREGAESPSAASPSKSAVDALREMILSGELSPGSRLPPERTLAQMFGFSRSSVREAVRHLAALGILTARQGDGTYVSEVEFRDLFAPLDFALRVDRKSLLHYCELRVIIEPQIAAMATGRLGPEGIQKLQDALAVYEREAESGAPNLETLIEADEVIHNTLIESAGNPLLAAIIRSVAAVARRGREMTVGMATAPRESLNELRAVVDAVIERDPTRALAAMTWHIARWEYRIRRELKDELNGEPEVSS